MNLLGRKVRRGLATGVLIAVSVLGSVIYPGTPVKAADPITDEDYLVVDGTMLKTKSGKEVTLRGTNVGGWLVQEGWMTPTNSPYQKETIKVLTERFGETVKDQLIATYEENYFTDKDLDFIADFGMNVLRVPFSYMNLLDSNGVLKENAWERLDWIVEEAGKRGIYVILDLHGAQGSQNGNDHSGDASDGARLFKTEEYIVNTVKLWEEIAAHFKGNPTVAAYDLLNEPGGETNQTNKVQWDVYDRIYDAVRAVDPDHVIMIESCWEPSNIPKPSEYGWENVVYEYHNYCWNADNDFNKQKEFVDMKVNGVNKANYGVPTFVGEFTAFTNQASWQYTLGKYNEAGFSWTTWTYKVTGNSSWGIVTQNVPKVDIYNDSAEDILEKWSKVGESDVNTVYHDVIKEYITGSTTMPKQLLPKVQVEPTWYQNLDGEPVIEAGAGATVKLVQEDGANAIELTTSETKDPGDSMNSVKLFSQFGKNQDISGYLYLIFEIKDTQGDNTHKITMKDGKGKMSSIWSSASSKKDEWVKVAVPLSAFSGIDTTTISELRIGEWNQGTYYIRNVYFAQADNADLPKNNEQNNAVLMKEQPTAAVVKEKADIGTLIGLFIAVIISIVGVYYVSKWSKNRKK